MVIGWYALCMSEISTTNKVGRPLKFSSVEDLQRQIDAYFADCDPHWTTGMSWREKRDSSNKVMRDDWEEYERRYETDQIPYTITGMALALDTTRDTLLDYESGNYDNVDFDDDLTARFSDTIKKAKLKIHGYAERRLDGNNPTGTIFSLKNNFGWVDKTESDITSKGESIKSEPVDKSDLDTIIALVKQSSADQA